MVAPTSPLHSPAGHGGGSGSVSSKTGNNTIHGTASSLSHRKIFAGGLHYGTDEGRLHVSFRLPAFTPMSAHVLAVMSDFYSRVESLRRYFGVFGKITAAQVMYNRETCKSRGFGFVIFEDETSVDRALANRMHIIDEKTVRRCVRARYSRCVALCVMLCGCCRGTIAGRSEACCP